MWMSREDARYRDTRLFRVCTQVRLAAIAYRALMVAGFAGAITAAYLNPDLLTPPADETSATPQPSPAVPETAPIQEPVVRWAPLILALDPESIALADVTRDGIEPRLEDGRIPVVYGMEPSPDAEPVVTVAANTKSTEPPGYAASAKPIRDFLVEFRLPPSRLSSDLKLSKMNKILARYYRPQDKTHFVQNGMYSYRFGPISHKVALNLCDELSLIKIYCTYIGQYKTWHRQSTRDGL